MFRDPANAFVMDFLGNVNLFHGRIESGKAVFGTLVVDRPNGREVDGQSAQLYVRPHDLDIHRRTNGQSALGACIERIQSAGNLVKIELASDAGQPVHVEMSHERFRQESLTVGEHVFITPREAKVFVADYSI